MILWGQPPPAVRSSKARLGLTSGLPTESPDGAALRKEIYESKSSPEILGRVENFFEARLCIAATTTDSSKLVAHSTINSSTRTPGYSTLNNQ